jgi:hypothetical protein
MENCIMKLQQERREIGRAMCLLGLNKRDCEEIIWNHRLMARKVSMEMKMIDLTGRNKAT